MKRLVLAAVVAVMSTTTIIGRTAADIQESEAIEMLGKYMQLPDKVAKDEAFFRQHVKNVLRARDEMPWGKDIPEREFMHFVLPPRVNNEPMSPYNSVIYDELYERVKDLDMKEAILEINHWCHEKVTYQPSDSRTHSPLESMSSAIGRCGEESTFTVSALRSMCIPARQVYTPRWAHTDDNHAWVEAWADGQWYFLGACEPEAILNLGWFNAPASRGMLMNTRVFGQYDGPEEVLNSIPGYTDINVTYTYAPLKTTKVTVIDNDGNPVENAKVSFRLYNYAEYFPLCIKRSDANGEASLTTGKGAMMIWASDDNGNFGFIECPGDVTACTVKLGGNDNGVYEYHLVPPAAGAKLPYVDPELQAINDSRKAYEDSIRTAYMNTFVGREQAEKYASELVLDKERTITLFNKARGNHNVIYSFLSSLPIEKRNIALMMLESMSVKDMADITLDMLNDQIPTMLSDNEDYVKYILNPRVSYEFLEPFRNKISSAFNKKDAEKMRKNPLKWQEWVAENIDASAKWQPATVLMSPEGVMRNKYTNKDSRDVFFVAGARSLGIPARMDLVRSVPQWQDSKGNWHDAVFENKKSDKKSSTSFGNLTLAYEPTKLLPNPGYYYHFSLSKIVDGQPVLLEYDDNGTWADTFKDGTQIEEGKYMLTTGQRMADGSALARSVLFDIAANENLTVPLVMRSDDAGVKVIGNFNSEDIYYDRAAAKEKSLLSTTGRGYYVLIYAAPNHEPSNHTLRDMAELAKEYDELGIQTILIFGDKSLMERFREDELPALPKSFHIGADVDGKISSELSDNLFLNTADAPVVIIADTFNRVVFESQGYSIGLGRQVLETLLKVEN